MVEQIAELEAEIAQALDSHPDGEIFRSFFRSRASVSAPRRCWRRSATAAPATRTAMRSPPRPGTPQSPSSPETQDRQVPMGVQQALTQRARLAGAQQPPLESLGRRPVRQRPRPRTQAHPGATHPRSCVEPHRVELLAAPHPLRPATTQRAATARHRHDPNPDGPPARPRRYPADARRRRHRNRGPQGRAPSV